MRYDQFAALCEQEWVRQFGDVTALNLTSASLAELTGDLRTAGVQLPLTRARDSLASERLDVATGKVIPVTGLINPVTRSFVDATGGNSTDTATVSFGTSEWAPPPRVITIIQGEPSC